MSLLIRTLRQAIGAVFAGKSAARMAAAGRVTQETILSDLPRQAELSRQIIRPLYKAYLREVSNSAWVISFETAGVLHGLCALLRPTTILDLGSGFTSAAFRFYAKTAEPHSDP